MYLVKINKSTDEEENSFSVKMQMKLLITAQAVF